MKGKSAISIIILLIILMSNHSMVAATACRPLLWPGTSAVINTSSSVPQGTMAELQRLSEKLLLKSTKAIPILSSSGKTNINDADLIASREALKDADRAAVLALTYHLTHKADYFNKAREILVNWASVNSPTGNPIDETKLEGMVWAYDLISCDLSSRDDALILNWFERLRIKKAAWKFGKTSSENNYRIHQLKMLLMLDIVLKHKREWQNDLTEIKKYSTINLNPKTGVSIDYLERSALYYHNYVLQPWLEISLITGCCRQSVKQAFAFLSNKILSHQIGDEFSHSQAKIDGLRANGGFDYALKGGTFDITKAAPTIVMYYTIDRGNPEPSLWRLQKQSKSSPWMTFLRARRLLWQT